MNATQTVTVEAQAIINEIKRITAINEAITKAGGFFTVEQIENERKTWKMKMNLRFDYGIEIGTY